MNFERTKENLPPQDPIAVIEGIRAEIMVTGAVDVEGNALDEIRRSLESGEITAEEAIKRARTVQVDRQEYR